MKQLTVDTIEASIYIMIVYIHYALADQHIFEHA